MNVDKDKICPVIGCRQKDDFQSPNLLTFKQPRNYSKESIPPAYVAFRAGTSNRVVVAARQAELLKMFNNSGSGKEIRKNFVFML